jgi:hypothetical protein
MSLRAAFFSKQYRTKTKQTITNKTKQDKKNKTKQNKTKQNKNKTKQNKIKTKQTTNKAETQKLAGIIPAFFVFRFSYLARARELDIFSMFLFADAAYSLSFLSRVT